MTPDVQALLDLVQQFGIWIVFAWLFITEKRDHAETRRTKDIEIDKVRTAHLSDIREFARLNGNLYSVQQPAVPRTPQTEKPPV